jgi:hypothetical protein
LDVSLIAPVRSILAGGTSSCPVVIALNPCSVDSHGVIVVAVTELSGCASAGLVLLTVVVAAANINAIAIVAMTANLIGFRYIKSHIH